MTSTSIGASPAHGENFRCIFKNFRKSLCLVYCLVKITTELWSSLDKKYKTKDASTKKSVVSKLIP